DATRHRVRIRPERAPDRDDQLAHLELARAAQIGDWHVAGVDLDDREVRQRVDAVDAALEHPAVIELDRQAIAALDDVAVGEDPAVRVVDDAGPDAGLRDDALRGVDAAVDGDSHDGRARLGGDIDRRG